MVVPLSMIYTELRGQPHSSAEDMRRRERTVWNPELVVLFPTIALAGQMIFAGCFLGAFVLFSLGVAWILLAVISIAHVRTSAKIPFSMAYWGLIFPNGVFALLCVQLAKVLDSPVFRAIGAAWCGMLPLRLCR